ncbi:MAG: radical SAM protein [Actinomycetota bacterium]
MDKALPEKVDRTEVFVEYTKSICPVCKVVVDAEVNIRQQRVYLRKRCREHGVFEALLYSDARMYLDSMRFNKPGTYPLETHTTVDRGCPLDCGFCPDHKQHACLGIIEVNTGCNLDCPLCFADSGHQPDGFSLTVQQVADALDAFVRAEGDPEVVMFSGGEPTIHPQILEFVAMAVDRGIELVVLNTNGIRLARDQSFVDALAAMHPRPRIYLQFDGLEERTHRELRGRDLRELKQLALDRCAEAGLVVILAAAVQRGVNEHEVGPIVRFGMNHPAVRGVAFQPATHAGRHGVFDPMDRVTNADVIHALADQLPDWFEISDFVPVPCCFPTCRSITYALVDGETVVPIPRLLDVEDYLDYLTNRVMPDPNVRSLLEKLWSASAFAGSPGTDERLEALGCLACSSTGPPLQLQAVEDKVFMIVIQDFQDPYTLNVKQLMKCCVAEIVPDGRIIPFCAYNSVGYREQVREQLSGVPVPTVVPNSFELSPLLTPTRFGSKTVAFAPEGHRSSDSTNVGESLR